MSEKIPKGSQVYFSKLNPGRPPSDDPLTDKEVIKMSRHGIMRAAHNLWLAERYLMDLSKLGYGQELDSHLMSLSRVTEYIENEVSCLITGNRPKKD